jgi:hypothetical protein
LDPNNYRFQDNPDFVPAQGGRFHERTVQDRAFRKLREEGLLELKNSILKNGLLRIERLVVRSHVTPKENQEFYLVVEGNRRLAALRWILQDHDAGVPIDTELLASFETVPVIVVEGLEKDPTFLDSLLGVRHVSSIRPWGGYQRSLLVTTLKDKHKLDPAEIGERLGMTTTEVYRRYRAFKALQQMQQNDEFRAQAGSDKYPLFHEAVSLTAVKEWLVWDDKHYKFTNTESLRQFYELLTRPEPNPEDGASKEAKISAYSQVRELRDILPNPDAKRVLIDPDRSFLDAITIAKRDELKRSWASLVAEASSALRAIGASELKAMSPDDIAAVRRLADTANETVENYRILRNESRSRASRKAAK